MILSPEYECADQRELMNKVIIPRLSSLFIRAYDEFSYYRWRFDESGIDPASDPIDILEKFPFMTKRDYNMLEQDALSRANKTLYHIEMTSGSTGKPKRRFESRNDELNELELAMRVCAGFDISKDDIIVFMDVGNPSIYIWFAKAFEAIGLKDTIYYGIQSDFEASLHRLIDIDPDVLFTVPSLLARSYEAILRIYNTKSSNLRKIIYFGEKMDDRFRNRIEEDLGVEVFSHYGGTETSTLGGECTAHEGIHIYNDANLPYLANHRQLDEAVQEGEATWTTMLIDAQPVIKYRIGDLIKIDSRKCRCGRTSPRIRIIGRADEGFSIYGEKFYYDTFFNVIYDSIRETGFLQIVLSNEGKRELMTIMLPDKLKNMESSISENLHYMSELEFFIEEGFLELETKFVPNSYFDQRKIPSIIDQRKYS